MQCYQHDSSQIINGVVVNNSVPTADLHLKFWPIINVKVRFNGHTYLSIMPWVSQIQVLMGAKCPTGMYLIFFDTSVLLLICYFCGCDVFGGCLNFKEIQYYCENNLHM